MTTDFTPSFAALAAYDETCADWQEVCHREEHGDIDATDQIAASESYYDSLAEHAHALATELRKALDELGVSATPVPPFPFPADADDVEDGDEVTCPYVYTEADREKLLAAHERHIARMREQHGDAANLPTGTPELPEVGEVCGAVMEINEKVWEYRPVHWGEARNGERVITIGDGQYGDGEFHSFSCESGHEFAPDWGRTDYGW